MKVNLGCENTVRDGWTNVNSDEIPGVDLVHDLDVFPWPFDDGVVNEIAALGIFQHVSNLVAVMSECHRILRPDGKLKVKGLVGDNPRLWEDVRRKRGFTAHSFDAFDPETKIGRRSGYVKSKWRKLHARKRDGEIIFYLEKR